MLAGGASWLRRRATVRALSTGKAKRLTPPRLRELVLVRHGESEGNIAHQRSLRGDHSLYDNPHFARRHSSMWRLTNRGIEEAIKAGQWLRENIDVNFDRFYVSEYVRAMETASKLALPNAIWYAETFLRERDLGIFDLMSHAERRQKFAEELRRRERDRFFFAPPGGESLADVCLRVDRMINILHRECQDQRVIIVCHGEVMWAFRIRLERMGQLHYREMEQIQSVHDHIHNCQVLHYTRDNPHTGETAPWLTHMRSVCPWDLGRSRNTWEEIERPKYTSVGLMQQVVRVHRIIDDDAAADRLSREQERSQPLWEEMASKHPAQHPAAPAQPAAPGAPPPAASAARPAGPEPPAEAEVMPARASARAAGPPPAAAADGGAHAASAAAATASGFGAPSSPAAASAFGGDEMGAAIFTGAEASVSPWWPAQTLPSAAERAPALARAAGAGSKGVSRALALRRIALVSKSTRLDRVGAAVLDVDDALAHRLRDAHERHAAAIDSMQVLLEKQGIQVTPVGVQNARPDLLAGADLVVCAGGDGTILSTAAQLLDGSLLLGVNTDPERSTGALTCLAYEDDAPSREALLAALERLRRGTYTVQSRRRIVVRIRPVGGSEYTLPRLALNDVFISERNSGRVYACEAAGEGGPVRVRRSSGLLFATGTGSTARLRNQMRIDARVVEHVLREAIARGAIGGVAEPADAHTPVVSEAECIGIAESWTKRWSLSPDTPLMAYSILEPMVPDCAPRNAAGHVERMLVKSLGHNTVLTLDGFYEHPIRYGDELTVAIGDEDTAVHTVHFPSHDVFHVQPT